VSASDGLPARRVGPWSKGKLDYIGRYLGLFSTAMRQKFPIRHYVDLFAGPGRCVVDDGSGQCDGSPILALGVKFPFTVYHFVEKDGRAMAALQERVRREYRDLERSVRFYPGDANAEAEKISSCIPQSALSVVVADPTGLQLAFESLRMLAGGARRADLIYLFPEGMSIKRNEREFLKKEKSKLDAAMGSRDWRGVQGIKVMQFRKELETLGYKAFTGSVVEGEPSFKNRKGVMLYYLVYASKHDRGYDFWRKVRLAVEKREPDLFRGAA